MGTYYCDNDTSMLQNFDNAACHVSASCCTGLYGISKSVVYLCWPIASSGQCLKKFGFFSSIRFFYFNQIFKI